jgi:hypothetical protein
MVVMKGNDAQGIWRSNITGATSKDGADVSFVLSLGEFTQVSHCSPLTFNRRLKSRALSRILQRQVDALLYILG